MTYIKRNWLINKQDHYLIKQLLSIYIINCRHSLVFQAVCLLRLHSVTHQLVSGASLLHCYSKHGFSRSKCLLGTARHIGKLLEPKAFYGESKQARIWLSAMKQYFQAVGLEEYESSHSIQMCNIYSALL